MVEWYGVRDDIFCFILIFVCWFLVVVLLVIIFVVWDKEILYSDNIIDRGNKDKCFWVLLLI